MKIIDDCFNEQFQKYKHSSDINDFNFYNLEEYFVNLDYLIMELDKKTRHELYEKGT